MQRTGDAFLRDRDPYGWVGAVIGARYRVQDVAGHGGYSTVYRAFDERLRRPVAIKCLECRRATSQEAFLVEAQRLYDLGRRAEGVVHVLDFGDAASPTGVWTPYIALEWLEGETLRAYLDRRGALSLGEAIARLGSAARSLDLVHGAGIVHRDLKPENLFVIEGARIKLLDFGVAKALVPSVDPHGASTGPPTSCTWEYAAPEQFDRSIGATGPWTDVHALALLLIELVSGRRAYRGQSLVEIAREATDPTRPTLEAAAPRVQAVIAEALVKDPRARFQSVAAFWHALTTAVAAARGTDTPSIEVRSRTPELLPAAPASTTGPQMWIHPAPQAAPASIAPPARRSVRRSGTKRLIALAVIGATAVALFLAVTTRTTPGEVRVAATTVEGVGTIRAYEAGPLRDPATFVDAMVNCLEAERAVCTETQWIAACAQEPALANTAIWTSTYGPDQRLAVAGGADCKTRVPARGSELHPYRCCTRAIAVRGSSAQRIGGRVLAYERALNAKDSSAVAGLLGAKVDRYYLLKDTTPKAVRTAADDWFKKWPDQWGVTERCTSSGSSSVAVECRRIAFWGGKLTVLDAQLVFRDDQLVEVNDVVIRARGEP